MKSNRKVTKFFIKALTTMCLIVLIFSAFKIFEVILGYVNNNKIYNEVREDIGSIVDENLLSIDDYNKLININDDFRFWIKIPGTNVDYPVVQSKDNEEYLNKDFNGDDNRAGCIFIDSNNIDLNDKNTIIHGHNMKDGSMFGSLKKFNDKEFTELNRKIIIYAKDKTIEYEIFSVYIEESNIDTYNVKLDNDEEYSEYIKLVTDKSNYNMDKMNYINKNIITISTCSFDIKDGRLVIHAMMI